MGTIKKAAFAKINLSLDVLSRREDGYHNLRMIMQQVDLKDDITLTEIEEGITISSDDPKVPTDATNLVYKAWAALNTRYPGQKGVKIHIKKNIPIAAGLAGGSSDAAAVLKGLNELWKLNLSQKDLEEIGLTIGADVPYCLMGGTALAEGVGEKLTALPSFKDKLVLLAKPDSDVSTAHVFKSLNLDGVIDHPKTEVLIKDIDRDDVANVAKYLGNVLETVTIKEHPVIEAIKEQMIGDGALGSLMSGSGPTVFGIFDNERAREACYQRLKRTYREVYKVKTI